MTVNYRDDYFIIGTDPLNVTCPRNHSVIILKIENGCSDPPKTTKSIVNCNLLSSGKIDLGISPKMRFVEWKLSPTKNITMTPQLECQVKLLVPTLPNKSNFLINHLLGLI